jgi:hypothetical protein
MPLEAQSSASLVSDRWTKASSVIGSSDKKKPGSRPLGPLPGCKPRRQALTRHVAIAHCHLAAVLSLDHSPWLKPGDSWADDRRTSALACSYTVMSRPKAASTSVNFRRPCGMLTVSYTTGGQSSAYAAPPANGHKQIRKIKRTSVTRGPLFVPRESGGQCAVHVLIGQPNHNA